MYIIGQEKSLIKVECLDHSISKLRSRQDATLKVIISKQNQNLDKYFDKV